MTVARSIIEAAAARLNDAALSGIACAPVADLLGPDEIRIGRLLQPKAEAEAAFVLTGDIGDIKVASDPAAIRNAVAVAWLTRTLIEVGTPLRAGDLVLSGALGPMVSVSAGDVFEAAIAPLGTVTARISAQEELR